MNKLRLYSVQPYSDADWQILVVAHSVREAKKLGWEGLPEQDCDYIDMRVKWIKDLIVPAEIKEPVVIDICGEGSWTCEAWGLTSWCNGCPKEEEKRKEWGGEEWMP
jgi:hypothetical protein